MENIKLKKKEMGWKSEGLGGLHWGCVEWIWLSSWVSEAAWSPWRRRNPLPSLCWSKQSRTLAAKQGAPRQPHRFPRTTQYPSCYRAPSRRKPPIYCSHYYCGCRYWYLSYRAHPYPAKQSLSHLRCSALSWHLKSPSSYSPPIISNPGKINTQSWMNNVHIPYHTTKKKEREKRKHLAYTTQPI